MPYTPTTRLAASEAFKLRFILRQKALPESFMLRGEGFSEKALSETTVESLISSGGQEVLHIHLPKEIGVTALAESGIRLFGLFRNAHASTDGSHDFIVPADSFRILADKDLAAPLEDLINTPFYLASVIQKEMAGVKKLPSCMDSGEMIRVLSLAADNAIIKLRDDAAPSLVALFGFNMSGCREYGSAFSVPVISLIEGAEKAIENLKLQDDHKNNLGALTSRLLGTNVSVISYSMICDGVIGVGIDTRNQYAEELKKFEGLLQKSNVHYEHFTIGDSYV